MKTFIILVLLAALAAAAHFTKPANPKEDFTSFLAAKLTQGDNGVVAEKWDEMQARSYASRCEYFDRFFWVSVKKDGKTVYTGAFSHWFNRAEIKKEIRTDIQELKDKASTEVNNLNAKKHDIEDLTKKIPSPSN